MSTKSETPKKVDSPANNIDNTNTNIDLEEQSVPHTPKGGVKRILTPSPVLRYQCLKKSRQLSGGMADSKELETLEEAMLSQGTITVEPAYVSVPMDPRDITRIANELKLIMLPEIRSVIKDEVPDTQSIVDSAVDSAVRRISETLVKEVSSLKTENSALKMENDNLKKSVTKLQDRVVKLEMIADDSEQYSRRNCIRITGIPEDKDEDTDQIVLKMARDLNNDMKLEDIDRSHRVGKAHTGRARAILVKFSTYRARRNLYSKRMELRNSQNWSGIFINEDLTARRSEILFITRRYVRAKLLKSSYSYDGRIYVRDLADTKHLVTVVEDLRRFGELPLRETEMEIDPASTSTGRPT